MIHTALLKNNYVGMYRVLNAQAVVGAGSVFSTVII